MTGNTIFFDSFLKFTDTQVFNNENELREIYNNYISEGDNNFINEMGMTPETAPSFDEFMTYVETI